MKMKMILLSILIVSNTMAQSMVEGDRGHGGDSVAQEFTLASTIALEYAKYSLGRDLTAFDYELLESSLKNTKVFATENKLCKDKGCKSGVEFVAVNLPSEKTININKSKWSALNWDQKLLISIHEHMGIVNLERDNYALSTKVLDSRLLRTPLTLPAFMVDRLTLTVRKEIFIPINIGMFNITLASGSFVTTVKYESESNYPSCEFNIIPSDKPRVLRIGRKIELHKRLGGLSTTGISEFQFFEATETDKSIKCKTHAEKPFKVLNDSYFEIDAWQGEITNG